MFAIARLVIQNDMATDNLLFRSMRLEDEDIVRRMVKALYKSLDVPHGYMTDQKIDATFQQLRLRQSNLELDVFELDGVIAGYALLFKFWYNEIGGLVLNVDELFVLPDFRERGIASRYLATLNNRRDYVALSLEVLPQNEKAYSLYKRMGFAEKETVTLYKILEQ